MYTCRTPAQPKDCCTRFIAATKPIIAFARRSSIHVVHLRSSSLTESSCISFSRALFRGRLCSFVLVISRCFIISSDHGRNTTTARSMCSLAVYRTHLVRSRIFPSVHACHGSSNSEWTALDLTSLCAALFRI